MTELEISEEPQESLLEEQMDENEMIPLFEEEEGKEQTKEYTKLSKIKKL